MAVQQGIGFPVLSDPHAKAIEGGLFDGIKPQKCFHFPTKITSICPLLQFAQ